MPSLDEISLLRFITCGSVDDGKSTLIGRLLHETRQILEDQADALARDSKKHGTTGDDIDFALLVDGLEAEREQGITIDVAYRFFATLRRKFIVADTPGHEQYTRNMATGASTADLAVVLVDARKGVLTQTRRHSYIASLLGIRHVILAVNKMDLVGFDQAVFDRIVADYAEVAQHLGLERVEAVPLSARFGDNIAAPSARLPWYGGSSLIALLEGATTADRATDAPFRLPIQYVSRPDLDFRGFAGTVASGQIAEGDPVTVAKSGISTRVRRIVGPNGDQDRAIAGQAVTLVLADEVEASRGNMLTLPTARPNVADQFAADIVWMDAQPMLPGRSYLLRTETDQVAVTITDLKHRQDVNTFAREAAKSLALNEIGFCNLSTQAPIAFDPYAENRITGAFVLIDRMTNATAGAGMIRHPLRRAANVHWQALTIDGHARARIKHQKPAVLWFTGLSGSGKSTIANLLEKRLHAQGRHTIILDGDNVRHGLNRDLGFTEADRVENIRRVAEVAKLMAEAGLLVIVSFISPFQAERRMARELMPEGQFIEIFVDTPFEVCAARDTKGLYARALRGEIANFTGVDSPYEPPVAPELRLPTVERDAVDLAAEIENWLAAGDYLC